MLKLRNLQIFRAVLEAGSISRAARTLNLTQPAVSLALTAFEKDLGFRLFHRSRGYFAPTAEALMLAEDAEKCLMSVERLSERARAIAEGGLGAISVASNGAVAINLLPEVITAFQAAHPDVGVDLKIRSSRQIAAWVAGAQVDFGLIDAPVPVSGVEARTFRIPCVCVMRENDALAAHAVIRPAHLAGRSVIAITGDHPIDLAVDAACAAAGAAIKRRAACGYFAIARNLVSKGAGVAIVDAINAGADLQDGATQRPFEPLSVFELALIRPGGQSLSGPHAAFLKVLEARLERFQA